MANNQIALLAQAPEFDTPFESQGKALQIRNLMNQGAVQDMDMQQRRQAIADDAGMRGVYSTVSDPAERIKALYRINPKAAQAAEKAHVDMDKDRAATGETTAKTRTENLKAINMRMQQARDLLGNVGDKQSATTWVQGLYADPDIGEFLTHHAGTLDQALARIPDPQADPDGFNKWRMGSQLGADKLVETTMPKAGTRNLGNRSQTTMTDPITGKVTVTDSQAIGQSPDSVASNATTRRGQNMTDARARETLDAGKSQIVQGENGPVLVNTRTGAGRTITGADGQPVGAKLKDIPASVNTAIIANSQSLAQLDKTIQLLQGKDTAGQTGDSSATGFKGYLPQQILNAVDSKGIDARAGVADIGSLKLHDRSGAAVTASESPRLMPFIPTSTDSNETALKKLRRLRQEVASESAAMGETYGKDQGYRPNPILTRGTVSAPTAPTTNARGWVLHTDASGNKAYVSPDGKSFEEVK